MAEWVAELCVVAYRGVEVASFTHNGAGVHIGLSDARTLRSQYLVGCDGARSVVRKQAGIELVEWEESTTYLIAECTRTDPVRPHTPPRLVLGRSNLSGPTDLGR